MKSSLSDLLCYLVSGRGQNFYARILAALELQESHLVPTMGVTIRDRHYVLLFNPDWFKQASYEMALCVIEHEAYHIVHEHIPRYLEYEVMATTDEQKHYLNLAFPFAVDMAVNTLLERSNKFLREHRQDFVLPNLPPWFNYEAGRSFDRYLSDIIDDIRTSPDTATRMQQLRQAINRAQVVAQEEKENENKKQEKGASENEMKNRSEDKSKSEDKSEKDKGEGKNKSKNKDKGARGSEGKDKDDLPHIGFGYRIAANHDHWINGGNSEKAKLPDDKLSLADELRQKTKQMIQQAVDDHIKNHGTIPAEITEQVKKLLKRPQVPFTQILRSWVVATQKYRRRRSVTRVCRRHIGVPDFWPFPGSGKERKFTVVWITDTSGSMGSKELEMGLNELASLQRAEKDIDIIVIEADACVEHEYHLSKPQDKISYAVHGRGGTVFDPALIRAKELRPDIVFYFTDGYAPPPAVENRLSCPFAWVITPNGIVPDPNWGKVIKTREDNR